MNTQLYHIAQILEIFNLPKPKNEILFPLGKYIKNKYREIKKRLPEKSEFFERGEKFSAFAYREKDFELIITLTKEFIEKLNKYE